MEETAEGKSERRKVNRFEARDAESLERIKSAVEAELEKVMKG